MERKRTSIQIGDSGTTLGPLKPTGRVSVNGHTVDASSEGGWIDSDSDVVVVGGNTRRVIVRVLSGVAEPPKNNGEPLPEEKAIETTPLQSPPAWVERINSVTIGLVIGIVLVPCVWLFGTPFSLYAMLVPVAGAIAGWLFRVFVGTAIQTVGPREDHRPQARVIAMIVLTCAVVASAIVLNAGFGFLGLCCGIPFGAAVGGMLAYTAWFLSHVG